LESDDFNLDQIVNSTINWASNPIPLSSELKYLIQPSAEQFLSSELKALPSHLKYVYLGENEALSIIITSHLTEEQEENLLAVLRENKEANGWTIADIKELSPFIVQHRIHLIEEARSKRDPHRRFNPIMQEAFRVEILKLLDNGIIYPISDTQCVSPVHAVPKKARFTVVKNDKMELV